MIVHYRESERHAITVPSVASTSTNGIGMFVPSAITYTNRWPDFASPACTGRLSRLTSIGSWNV